MPARARGRPKAQLQPSPASRGGQVPRPPGPPPALVEGGPSAGRARGSAAGLGLEDEGSGGSGLPRPPGPLPTARSTSTSQPLSFATRLVGPSGEATVAVSRAPLTGSHRALPYNISAGPLGPRQAGLLSYLRRRPRQGQRVAGGCPAQLALPCTAVSQEPGQNPGPQRPQGPGPPCLSLRDH